MLNKHLYNLRNYITVALGMSCLVFLSTTPAEAAMNFSSGTESLSADSSTANKKNGIVTFSGNVAFSDSHIQLSADNITISEKPEEPRNLEVIGAPLSLKQNTEKYRLNAAAKQLSYLPQKRQLQLKQDIKLTVIPESKEPLTIKASQIDYHFDDNQQKPIQLQAKGSPATFELVEINGHKIIATSERIHYSSKQGVITMEKNVSFAYQGDQVTAEKLIFDINRKAWQVPAVKNKRFEIIKKPNP